MCGQVNFELGELITSGTTFELGEMGKVYKPVIRKILFDHAFVTLERVAFDSVSSPYTNQSLQQTYPDAITI